MPVIGTLTDLQRGTLWGGFVEVFLVGIYSCLLVVALWTSMTTRRPLTIIGWIIIAVYCLTLCRVVTDVCLLSRVLFVNGGGELATLEPIDYVLRIMEHASMFVAVILADGLFCWRLYVIWPRSIRVILFPAILLMMNAMLCMAFIVVELLLISHPHREQYLVSILRLAVGEVVTVLLYTTYTTVFIAGRLWWAGRESKKFGSLEEARGNRYRGAIAALVQSGVLNLITLLVVPITLLTKNAVAISVANEVCAVGSSISATLLVLQLNLFQLKRDVDGPPLTTGATFKFADLGPSSMISEESLARSSVVVRRRASMSMVEGQDSNPSKDEKGSIPLRMTFTQHDTGDQFIGTLSSSPVVNSNMMA
ncbi:hypothetical protein FRB95_014531 [Tulasnella sp. JGI-2019a]|nr:hypothetical protein FRB95_014531 [Tulasnella sp. JGI-2019a]